MKNPVLMIGIIFAFISLSILQKKGYLNDARDRFMPTSCRAVRVKLDKRIPENWKTTCEGNNLNINIQYIPVTKKEKSIKGKVLKGLLYNELLKYLIHVAKNSPSDNLERTMIVSLRLDHPNLQLNSVTEGKFLVKLATLKDKELIKQHLIRTVQTQEVPKESIKK